MLALKSWCFGVFRVPNLGQRKKRKGGLLPIVLAVVFRPWTKPWVGPSRKAFVTGAESPILNPGILPRNNNTPKPNTPFSTSDGKEWKQKRTPENQASCCSVSVIAWLVGRHFGVRPEARRWGTCTALRTRERATNVGQGRTPPKRPVDLQDWVRPADVEDPNSCKAGGSWRY